MKIYEIKKKKIEVTSTPPSYWPWFECFNNNFYGTTKISGILNAINQGVHVMNFEIKVVNVDDEEEVGMLRMPSSPKR
jgi:hypothetical protein